MLDSQKVDELAAVLKEVLSCSPNLLYHAAQKVGSDALLQVISEQLTPDVVIKQRKRTARIHLLSLEIGRVLMKTGDVEFTAQDTANMIAFMRLGNRP